MNPYKKPLHSLCICLALIPLLYLHVVVFQFGFFGAWHEVPVVELTEFSIEMDGENNQLTLPHVIEDGTAGQSVVLTTTLTDVGGQRLYFKSVFAPLQIFVNDELLYDYGGEGTLPSYLQDPPTKSAMIELPNESPLDLRLEYTYPTTRGDLILDPLFVGTYPSIFNGLMSNPDTHLFAFLVFLTLGLFLTFLGLIIRMVERKGAFFIWLGLISLNCGLWGLGECDLTGIVVHNESLLSLATFTSVFYLPISVHCFFRSTVGYRNEKPVTICIRLCLAVASIITVLQATSLVSFYNALPYFIWFAIATFLFGIGYTIREWRIYGNQLAKQFLAPWLLVIISTIVECVRLSLGYIDTYGKFIHMALIIFIIINTIIGATILRNAFALREESHRMEQAYRIMEVQVVEQQKYHHLLLETRQTLRQQRHDLHHQMTVVHGLAKSGNLDKINQLLADLKSDIPAELQVYCDNITVNTLVAYYAMKAKNNDITIHIDLVVPESAEQIGDNSLCVIFGNIMENALEACGRMNDSGKFITLTSHLKNGMLVIIQKNSFEGPLLPNGDTFFSSKREEFGIGLSSVQSVAKKYGGNATFTTDGRVFQSAIYVRIEK